jgi:hypothetical protein
MLIYLESIEVRDIVRHVNGDKVHYMVRVDGYFTSLDKVSNIMKNLPKRYVTAFDVFMGKVYKRVIQRVPYFERDEYYNINFLMVHLQYNSYIVPIKSDDIDFIRMYDKGDALELVSNMLDKKSEVEDILGDTMVNSKNDTMLDTEDLYKNFAYLYETLIRLYAKGYRTIEVDSSNALVLAVVQKYTQEDLDRGRVSRKTYLNITSIFKLLGIMDTINSGVYAIRDILGLPSEGDIVYMGDKPYYLHSISFNSVGTQYLLYPNHLNKEMYELLGNNKLEMTYKVRMANKNTTCNMFEGIYQDKWNAFIGG